MGRLLLAYTQERAQDEEQNDLVKVVDELGPSLSTAARNCGTKTSSMSIE